MTSAPKRDFMRSTTTSTWILRQAGHDLVARLRVAVQVDRRVLLLQAPQQVKTLSSSPLVLGSIAKAMTGWGSFTAGMAIGSSRAASQSPARVSLSLATAPMSPGPKPWDWRLSLPSKDSSWPMRSLAWARVFSVRVGLDRALVDPEEVDAPGERVGLGLEHVGEELALEVGSGVTSGSAPCLTVDGRSSTIASSRRLV